MKNRIIHKLTLILTFLLMLGNTNLSAQEIPDAPNPPCLVNDFAKILNQEEIRMLEQKLVRFSDTTSNQITIVTVNDLKGYAISDFAIQLGEKWKVGQAKLNNGVVIVVKPKIGNERGQAFIAPGYGLEPVITDAVSRRMIENVLIPEFRKKNYYAGLDKATDDLMKLASGEISSKEYAKGKSLPAQATIVVLFVIIMIIFTMLRSARKYSQSVGHGTSFWTALWLMSTMNNSHNGSWSNFSGGSGSGGGFGGFGGGSFGGGGAGGSW